MSGLAHHYEASALVQAPMEKVFAYVDDPTRLASHMSKSSWMMGGGQMEIELDSGRGQNVGSRIRLAGKVFGMQLSVEEVVTKRSPLIAKSGRQLVRLDFWLLTATEWASRSRRGGTVHFSAFISIMRCRKARQHVGSGTCLDGATLGGVLGGWLRTQ